MLKSLILFLAFLLFTTVSFAQKRDSADFYKIGDTTVIYYKILLGGDEERVTNSDKADFYKVVYPPDSSDLHLYNVKEFYKNGVCRFIGKSLPDEIDTLPVVLLEGNAVSFYPSGRKKSITTYKSGLRNGPAVIYYENGKIYCTINYKDNWPRYIDCYDDKGNQTGQNGNGHWIEYSKDMSCIMIEGAMKKGLKEGEWIGASNDYYGMRYTFTYEKGEFKKGQSWDKKGNTYTFNNITTFSRCKKGGWGWRDMQTYRLIDPQTNKRYPEPVKVTFIVEADGSMSGINTTTLTGNDLSRLNDQVINALNKSGGWVPYKYYGRPIRSRMAIALNLIIRGRRYIDPVLTQWETLEDKD